MSPQPLWAGTKSLTWCEVSLSEENTSTLKSADLKGEFKILKTGLSLLDQSVQELSLGEEDHRYEDLWIFLPPAIVKAHSEYTNVIHLYYAICNNGTLNNNYEGDQNRYTGDLSEK